MTANHSIFAHIVGIRCILDLGVIIAIDVAENEQRGSSIYWIDRRVYINGIYFGYCNYSKNTTKERVSLP